jgi:protoheme IX farnesyltransferase
LETIKTYYRLTKPGIIYGNAVTAAAGFLLASGRHIDAWLLLSMLVGLSLIIAAGCVFNNCIDRNIDSKMSRTKQRALVTGKVSTTAALLYAAVLGAAGSLLLGLFTNTLTLLIALSGLFAYTVLYSIWKRRSSWGTVVGSLSGAVPPVVGYCAVTNRLDMGAFLLFLILVFWQMPHFYSIAIYRAREYKAARIPVLSLEKGVPITKTIILAYIVIFILTAAALSAFGYTGYSYLIIILAASLYWLWLGLKGYKLADSDRWARRMFGTSLLVITAFSAALAINAWLP